jgi:hypothetical protein
MDTKPNATNPGNANALSQCRVRMNRLADGLGMRATVMLPNS